MNRQYARYTYFAEVINRLKIRNGLLLAFFIIGLIPGLFAQNNEISVNVQVLPPYSNDIYDYIGSSDKITRSFQEQIIVTLRNNNPNRSYEVKLIASVLGNNGVEAIMNQNFQPFQRIILPAGEMKIISGRDLAEINRNLTENDISTQGINSNQIRRTGTLPEGSYRICFQAFDFRSAQPLSTNQPFGCSAPITISNPDPPVIAYPFNDAIILATNPQNLNISWAPVTNADPRLRYKIKIVELNDINANPYDLMQQSNVAFYQQENLLTNNIFYDQAKPQLKAGYTYAIRVQAYDPFGQIKIKNNGLSEINLFRYANSYADGSGLSDMDFVSLVPGYVKLVSLDQLNYTQTAGVERFNGTAQLAFTNPLTETEELVNVQVNNLSLNSNNRQNPTFLSGEVSGALSTLPELMQNLQTLIDPSSINWGHEDGIVLAGDVKLADGTEVPVSGTLQLTPAGAFGQLKAGGQQTPIYELSTDDVRLKITEIIASFPENTVKGDGFLEFLKQQQNSPNEGPCEISNINLLQDQVTINVNCSYNESVPLVQNSDKVMLRFQGASGTVVANWGASSLDYDVQLLGAIDLKTTDDTYNCGINVGLNLATGTVPQMSVLGNNCELANREINLGLVQLNLRDIQLNELSYQQGIWDFELQMNGDFILPVFNNWTSPELKNIIIDKTGITISEQVWALDELEDLQNIGWDSTVSLSPDQIKFDAITYPWFDEITGQGPWNMVALGKASINNNPLIPCLNDYDYDFRLYYNSQDGLFGELSGEGEGCSWDFATESSITITTLKGELFADLNDTDAVKSATLEVTGNLNNSFLFQCEEEMDFDNVFLTLDSDFVRGSIQQFSPDCPIQIGPFGAAITNATLLFEVSDGSQEVLMDANANLILPDSTTVAGSFLYDMGAGKFLEIEFELVDPFTWNIPENNPVMSFNIEEAMINMDGFMIDGRNTLELPGGKSIRATFDRLTLNINTMEIESGQVIFDESFAFEAGIDTSNYSLQYKAVEQGQSLTLNPALYFSLGANVSLDVDGLQTGGNAEAQIVLGDQNFTEDLSVAFSDDFKIGLYPFKVSLGRADLLVNEQLIAYINDQGLTVDPLDFLVDALPDKIPLPANDIAYLKIRDIGGNLLIDVEKLPNGSLKIESLPNTTLQFYLPAVDPANPPVFGNVQLDNVQLNADVANPSIASGTVTITVPEGNTQLASLNLPVNIKQIAFGTNLFGSNTKGLFLSGELSLFDTNLPNAGAVYITVDHTGLAQASFNITGQGMSIPLVPNANIVTYELNSLSGSFSAYLNNLSAQNFALDLSGQFAINDQDTPIATADLDLHIEPGSFQITHFSSSLSENPIDLDFGNFGLKIKEISSIPVFDFTDAGGFDFAAALDLELYIDLADGERFELPLNGLEIRPSGLHIPAQNINPSSIPGLSIPAINIAGFELELLALRTTQPTVFDWYNLSEWNFSPSVDVAVKMPELVAKGLNLPDGLSFYDLSINSGLFSGAMTPFQPAGGLNINLGNLPDAPKFNISEIIGELLPDPLSGGQGFNIDLKGKLTDLPGFESSEAQACVNPEFNLSIVEGKAFEGTISNFIPCGNLEIGPFSIIPQNSELRFAYENEVQEVSLDGSVRLDLTADPSPNGLADGNVKLNLLTGAFMDGFIAINQAFPFAYPVENPLLRFTLNQARLDTSGFTMQGAGSLNIANINNSVSFNDLKLSLNDLTIKSGTANLGSNLNLDLILNPFGLSLSQINAMQPSNDHLRMSLAADVLLTSDGICYAGTSTASIRFAGEDYPALRAEFLDNFALHVHNLSVSRGQAEFYLDENGLEAEDPLAILDENGFNIGGGLVALLPDTLGLPTKELAYIILKDSQGNSLINATQNASNGWDISTKDNQPLTLVLPALANGQSAPQAQVAFSLTTDSNYNPNGGSISLVSGIDLQPNFNLPIELTELSLIANNKMEVSAQIKVIVPESVSDEAITSTFVVNSTGFKEASLEWGTYTQQYNASITPAFSRSIQGTLPNDAQPSNVAIHLYGIKAELGASTSLQMAGGLVTDLLAKENETPEPLFFWADYSSQTWTGGVDASYLTEGIAIGELTLKPDASQPFELEISAQRFVVKTDGVIDFKALVGEELKVSIQDLQIGVDYSQATPKPIFGLGVAAIRLPDQHIDLFDGEVALTLDRPALEIIGREIAISSDGLIDVFDRSIDFTGMTLSSGSGFNLGTVQMQSDIILIQDYAKLTALGLTQSQQELSLSASIEINLPEPVESSAIANVLVKRMSNNQVSVAVTGPEFNLNQRYAIGEVAEFELSKVVVDIEPGNMDAFGIYVAGKLLISDQPRIFFGDAAAIRTNPGIAYANQSLRYNATGNASFELDEGFFMLNINANMSISNATKFEVVLGGTAGVNISGVGGTLDYEDFTIGPDGVTDRGNLAGSGSLSLMGFASLTIGQFEYEVPANGETTVMVNLPVSNDDPSSFESKENTEVQFTATAVKRFIRFGGGAGPALKLTLGGANPDEDGSGGFGGGVEEVMFYELPNGDKFLKIDNANLAIGRTLTCNAFLQYQEVNGGFELQVTAAAEVGIGVSTAKAALAGYFANVNNDLRFGLFVGVEASTGIPLFPGIVTLTGGGAGFFYKPTQSDLDLITKANGPLMSLGHKMVRNELENPFNPPAINNLEFAVMLFAKVGILGSAGQYSLEGSTFLQITNRSVYFDAYGTVLGLDGAGSTKLKLQGGAYVQAAFDNFFIDGGGYVDLKMPVVLDGRMELIFFFAENPNVNNEVVWAIDGRLKVKVYSILNMNGTIIACPSGLYMDAGVGVKFGKYGFSVDAEFMGSVWYANDDSFQYPFGAYLKAEVELCFLGACAGPTAKAAFATLRGGGFELVVGAQACINIPIWGEECAHAMASMKSQSGFSVDVGTGKMKSSLFDEAEGMKAKFEDIVAELREEISATRDAVNNFTPEIPALEIPDEVLTSAGYKFHTEPFARVLGGFALINNIQKVASPLPPNLQWVKDNIMLGGSNSTFPMERVSKYGDEYDEVKNQKRLMRNAMDTSTLFLEEALVRMTKINGTAYEFKEQAQDSFDEMLVALETSPVSSTSLTVQQDADGKIISAPSFTIDENKAAQQNEKSAAAEGFSDQMKAEFERAIVATEKNLSALDSMLSKRLEKRSTQSASNSSTSNAQGGASQFNNGGQVNMVSVINQAYVLTGNTTYVVADNIAFNNYYPSVSDVSTSLRDAVESIERYYAYEGSFRARQYDWMNYAHGQLTSRHNTIKSTLGTVYSNANKGSSFLESNMKQRIDILYTLSNASVQEKQAKLNSTSLSPENFRISLENTWYDMHTMGLDEAKDDIAFNVIRDLSQERSAALALVNEPYGTLSDKINSAYVFKSEILAVLHGLYQQYNKVVNAADSTGVGEETNTLQQEIAGRLISIENSLMPPTINSIIIFSKTDYFRNKTNLMWSTSGTPIETAFQVQQQGDNTVATGYGSYKSIGNKENLDVHSFKDAFARSNSPDVIAYTETKDFSVGFRLRSIGGVTSLRRANFEVAVGPQSPESSVQWTNIKETDNTPPSIEYMYFLPSSKEPYADVSNPLSKNYYTKEQQSQYFQVGARDDESDIVKIEYAVGTASGLRDIVDWSLLTGERVRNSHSSYGNFNEPDEYLMTELIGRVNSLSLETGKRYYFSARVTNGEGLSTIASMTIPLAFDGTPPSIPRRRYTVVGLMPVLNLVNTVHPMRIKPLALTTPVYKPLSSKLTQIYNRLEQNPNMPTIDFRWSASNDSESGILGYEYYVSKDSLVDEDEFTGFVDTDLTSKTMRAYNNLPVGTINEDKPLVSTYSGSAIKDYGQHYLFIRSANNANNFSEIARIGPFTATDPTTPDVPDMQVTERSNALRIHIIENSFDPESGLKGYQYAIGTSANNTDLKNFPSGKNVDWQYSNYEALLKGVNFNFSLSGGSSGPEQPTFDIDKSSLPKGQPLYVFFRAVNQQGGKSAMVACGPIVLDDTPPVTPTMLLSTTNESRVKIKLEDVHDPESGVSKIIYKVGWKTNGISENSGFVTAFEPSTPTSTSRNFTFYKQIDNADLGTIKVSVWVYNGRDKYTFTEKIIPAQVINTVYNAYPQGGYQINNTW